MKKQLWKTREEFIAIGYAILTARSVENWKKRVFHVLPMFLLPAISSITYNALVNFIKMCERKDQKTLEDLRAERQSKIDELKEKTKTISHNSSFRNMTQIPPLKQLLPWFWHQNWVQTRA